MRNTFIEEEFIGALNSILGSYYPNYKLRLDRISSWDEKGLGYDGKVTIVKPLYIQFKRSQYYDINYNGRLRKKRNQCKIDSSTFYSFKLHRNTDAKTNKNVHKQHNLLFELLKNSEEAFYLAPLFHTKYELDQFNFHRQSELPREFIYEFYDRGVGRTIIKKENEVNQLIFDNTIGIKPHKIVNDKKYHLYSFDKEFRTTFHSEPELVEEGIFRFSDFLNEINYNDDRSFEPKRILNILESFYSDTKIGNILSDLIDSCDYYFDISLRKVEEIYEWDKKRILLLLEYHLKDYFNIV